MRLRISLVWAVLACSILRPAAAQAYRAEAFPSAVFGPTADSITVLPVASQSRGYRPVICGALIGLTSAAVLGGLGYGMCKDPDSGAGDDCLGRWAIVGAGSVVAGALVGLVLSGDPMERPE